MNLPEIMDRIAESALYEEINYRTAQPDVRSKCSKPSPGGASRQTYLNMIKDETEE